PSVWELPDAPDTSAPNPTHLEQCWFPGVHSNIGGSYDDTGIANLTLAWIMSRLAAFLDFDPDFVAQQQRANASYVAAVTRAAPKPTPTPSASWPAAEAADKALWASTTLYNSSSDFITGVLGGSSTRTPGRYHATDPLTNRRIQSTPLQHTHERMHASVRLRASMGGLVDGGKWSAYQPAALDGWRLERRKDSLAPGKADGGEEWLWVYEGDEEQFKGRVMQEDEAGVFERLLMHDAV
ncbi:MAG: DUF2235 domain-containing protein, partial [Terriglobus roseus]|nr:DUF2235 domain-containing protein [Terriglobus roseus]